MSGRLLFNATLSGKNKISTSVLFLLDENVDNEGLWLIDFVKYYFRHHLSMH